MRFEVKDRVAKLRIMAVLISMPSLGGPNGKWWFSSVHAIGEKASIQQDIEGSDAQRSFAENSLEIRHIARCTHLELCHIRGHNNGGDIISMGEIRVIPLWRLLLAS